MKKRRLYYHGDYAANGQIYNAVWDIFMFEEDFLRFDKFRPKEKSSSEGVDHVAQLEPYKQHRAPKDSEYYRPENAPNIFMGHTKRTSISVNELIGLANK